jgi:hypothetical protein
LREARKILRTKGPDAAEFMKFKDGRNVREFGHFIVWLEHKWMQISFLIEFDSMFKFFIVYCLISFFGILFSDVFYSLHMLAIINKVPTLKNVIRSVTLKS